MANQSLQDAVAMLVALGERNITYKVPPLLQKWYLPPPKFSLPRWFQESTYIVLVLQAKNAAFMRSRFKLGSILTKIGLSRSVHRTKRCVNSE